jgi:hypothetical protein
VRAASCAFKNGNKGEEGSVSVVGLHETWVKGEESRLMAVLFVPAELQTRHTPTLQITPITKPLHFEPSNLKVVQCNMIE